MRQPLRQQPSQPYAVFDYQRSCLWFWSMLRYTQRGKKDLKPLSKMTCQGPVAYYINCPTTG